MYNLRFKGLLKPGFRIKELRPLLGEEAREYALNELKHLLCKTILSKEKLDWKEVEEQYGNFLIKQAFEELKSELKSNQYSKNALKQVETLEKQYKRKTRHSKLLGAIFGGIAVGAACIALADWDGDGEPNYVELLKGTPLTVHNRPIDKYVKEQGMQFNPEVQAQLQVLGEDYELDYSERQFIDSLYQLPSKDVQMLTLKWSLIDKRIQPDEAKHLKDLVVTLNRVKPELREPTFKALLSAESFVSKEVQTCALLLSKISEKEQKWLVKWLEKKPSRVMQCAKLNSNVLQYVAQHKLSDEVTEELFRASDAFFVENYAQREKLNFVLDYALNFNASVQKKIFSEVLRDKKVSYLEYMQLRYLNSAYSKEQQAEFILKDLWKDYDWDKDDVLDFFEYLIAKNKTFSVGEKNDRFALIIFPWMDREQAKREAPWLFNEASIWTADPTEIEFIKKFRKDLIELHHFPKDHVYYFQGLNATSQNFKEALARIAQQSDSNDIVYIFIHTHGGPVAMTLYHPSMQGITLFMYEEVNSLLSRIPAKLIYVAAQHCGGDAAIQYYKSGLPPRVITRKWLALKTTMETRVDFDFETPECDIPTIIFYPTREEPYYVRGCNNFFTYDLNRDGYMSAWEWYKMDTWLDLESLSKGREPGTLLFYFTPSQVMSDPSILLGDEHNLSPYLFLSSYTPLKDTPPWVREKMKKCLPTANFVQTEGKFRVAVKCEKPEEGKDYEIFYPYE